MENFRTDAADFSGPPTRILTGRIKIHPAGYGFVVPDDKSEDVHVSARNRGSAMDADAGIPTSGRPDLEPYTLIAKSYAVRGETSISDRVLIAKDNQDWHLTNSMLEFVWLTFTYFVAVYGFHPELGFAWIAAFVALGWLIFRYASGRLAVGSYKPRSPLLLALDSVIPGIQLDKNHQDVRYDGWPQIMLYLLRILGAVLVFVAFSYLQKKLLG